MNVLATELEGVLIVEPKVFGDKRGFFLETYQKQRYQDAGIDFAFVQDNISFSVGRTLRGLHYQHPCDQAKLVQVLAGEIYDVAVDIRRGSPTFGRWAGVVLSAENRRQFFLPQGFAHGFCVMSETALFMYKCSDYYTPRYESGICWNDPDLAVSWPVQTPILSERDAALPCLHEIDPSRLPMY
jgi:dTDP-4-dehydrorhamnose 3,5-epimerase